MRASCNSFQALQTRYGFNVPVIKQFKQLALAPRSLPVTPAPPVPVPVKSTGARLAPAMLKRADKSLMDFTGLSYTTIYYLEKKGKFPARRQITPGRVCWLRSEVEAWLLAGERVVSE